MVLEKILSLEGYSTLKARNGKEGLDLAEKYPGDIDVIILDMKMPMLSGPEAFPFLSEARPNAKTIICTGYNMTPEIQALLDSGAASYMKKPFMPDVLLKEIKEVLGKDS